MRYVFLGAIFGLIFASSAFGADVPAATQPDAGNPQPDLSGKGPILVARWYVLLDEKAAASIAALGTAKDSQSKLYHAALFDAVALRSAMAKATADKDVLDAGYEVSFGKSMAGDGRMEIDPSFFIRLMVPRPKQTTLESDTSGAAEFDVFDPPSDDSVHVVLQHPDLKLTLHENFLKPPAATQPSEQAIEYDGQLKPGEALGFAGTYTGTSGTKYVNFVVWEAFRIDEWQADSFGGGASGVPTAWWIANGPEKMQMMADVSIVWAARAKHLPDSPLPEYSVELPNGAGVRLLGLSRPSRFGLCWWDPAGDPIDAPMHTGLASYTGRGGGGLNYAVQIRRSASEPPTPIPSNNDRPIDDDWNVLATAVPATGQIRYVLGEGPWKQIGEINSDQPLKVDRVTYTIADKGGRENRFWVLCRRSAGNLDVMDLTAVLKDGTEIGADSRGMSAMYTENRPVRAMFSDASLDQVKTFHVWLRKGHIVSFAGFAQSPNEKPPQTVTAKEVAAAAAVLRDQRPEGGQ